MKVVGALIGVILVLGIALIGVGISRSRDNQGGVAASPTATLNETPTLGQSDVVSRINSIICPGRHLSKAEAFGVTATYLGGHAWKVQEIDGPRGWTFNETTNALTADNETTHVFEAGLKSSVGCFGQRPDATPGG